MSRQFTHLIVDCQAWCGLFADPNALLHTPYTQPMYGPPKKYHLWRATQTNLKGEKSEFLRKQNAVSKECLTPDMERNCFLFFFQNTYKKYQFSFRGIQLKNNGNLKSCGLLGFKNKHARKLYPLEETLNKNVQYNQAISKSTSNQTLLFY